MELTIRKGTIEDTERYIALLHLAKDSMQNPEWFFIDTDEEVRDMMNRGIMELWVAMDGNVLAGAFSVLIPGMEEFNYGYDIGLPDDQLYKVVCMDTAVVHPAYRGMGLQKKLMALAEASFAGAGERILMCTVHPDNQYSLNNILALGYRIVKQGKKYGSLRCFMRKDID